MIYVIIENEKKNIIKEKAEKNNRGVSNFDEYYVKNSNLNYYNSNY